MNISVVICTCNRAESLEKTLWALSEASVPEGCALEIVIVDNRSTDSTRAVVEAFRDASGLPVIYAYEPLPGLSHARNRGLREAKGAIIAFTDDDVIVDRSWLREILRECRSGEDAAMIFGQTRRYSEAMPYLSIKEGRARECFAFPCSPWSVGHGNNMILKRDLVATVGNFDPRFGPGARVGAASDTEYVYRVLKAGRKILYVPSIIVYHNDGRISGDAVRRREWEYAKGRGAFYCKHVLRRDVWAAKMMYWEFRSLVGALSGNAERRRKAVRNLAGVARGILVMALSELSVAVRPESRHDRGA
jgi:GT2 family glycosyltransferase